ncbi:clavesin-2-like [Haematobia irritans]|uniref:clavesin-2-like n=1 Tax=Haematobia irritans TaxID=7368 RepID=UPI003F5063B5
MANIKVLDEELQKIANKELGEVLTRIPEDLAILRQWLQKQSHLKARQDDQFLIQFLRGCKYSLERAKEKIELYYTLKTKYPKMMNTIDVREKRFRDIHRLGCFQVLPNLFYENGLRIAILRFNFQPNKYNIEDISKIIIAWLELLMITDPYACIKGLVYVVDFGLATAKHYLQLTPSYCEQIVSFVEKSMPLRIKSIYFINNSTAVQAFLKILIPLLSQKLRKRLHILGSNMKDLYKHIPRQYLPIDYGGLLPSMTQLAEDFEKTWDDNHEYFQDNANYGVDESLRIVSAKNRCGLLGISGSFRKIDID